MTKTIEYFFTPLSGFAYLGHDRLKKMADEASAKISYRPLLIAKVFEANNTIAPPKQSQARLNYRRADMKRWAERYSLPITLEPKHWPTPDALAGRCIIAASMLGLDTHATARALMEGVWVKDKNIADQDDVMSLLVEAGMNAGKILDAAEMDEAESRQQSFTQEAIDKGVFGSPTYYLDGEIYWGQDRLSFVAEQLGLSATQAA